MKLSLALPYSLLWVLLGAAFQLVASAQGPTLQPAKLAEDFKVFRSALEEGDSGLYRYVSKTDLDQVFDRTASSLDHPMTTLEFYRIIAPAMAAVECGHNNIKLSEKLTEDITTKVPLLPVEIRILDNQVYVFRDYAGNGLTGVEIKTINGVRSDQILSTMFKAMSADGKILTLKRWRLGHGRDFTKYLYVLLGIQSPFHIEYVDTAHHQRQIDVAGVEIPKMSIHGSDSQTELSGERKDEVDLMNFSFIDGTRIGILDIYSFQGEYADAKHTVKIPAFIDNVFKELHDKGSKAVIIDVRDNGGGEDEYGEQLFSYLATEPYRYYDDLVLNTRSFSFAKYVPSQQEKQELAATPVKRRPDDKFSVLNHPNLGIHQPRQPHFVGKIYILMNGGSFSTTSEFLSTANYHKVATFIGEEEGGAYYGNTSGPTLHVLLPNSGLIYSLRPLTYYLSVKGNHAPDRGVMPDYPMQYSIEELVQGKDKDMELALKLARSQTTFNTSTQQNLFVRVFDEK